MSYLQSRPRCVGVRKVCHLFVIGYLHSQITRHATNGAVKGGLSTALTVIVIGSVLKNRDVVVVGWLLNVPATCECISGMDPLGQFYVLPH